MSDGSTHKGLDLPASLLELDRRIASTVGDQLSGVHEQVVERLRASGNELLKAADELRIEPPSHFLNEADIATFAVPTVAPDVAVPGTGSGALLASAARIDRARTQPDLLSVLLEEARHVASRSAFFLTRPDGAHGWSSRGFGDLEQPLDATVFSYEDETWSSLVQGHGPVMLGSKQCATVAERLDTDMGAQGALIPFVLRGHLAGALYADVLPDDDQALDVPALQLLAHLAALSLETLALRQDAGSPTLRGASADRDAEADGMGLWDPPADDTSNVAVAAAAAGVATAAALATVDAQLDAQVEARLDAHAGDTASEPDAEAEDDTANEGVAEEVVAEEAGPESVDDVFTDELVLEDEEQSRTAELDTTDSLADLDGPGPETFELDTDSAALFETEDKPDVTAVDTAIVDEPTPSTPVEPEFDDALSLDSNDGPLDEITSLSDTRPGLPATEASVPEPATPDPVVPDPVVPDPVVPDPVVPDPVVPDPVVAEPTPEPTVAEPAPTNLEAWEDEDPTVETRFQSSSMRTPEPAKSAPVANLDDTRAADTPDFELDYSGTEAPPSRPAPEAVKFDPNEDATIVASRGAMITPPQEKAPTEPEPPEAPEMSAPSLVSPPSSEVKPGSRTSSEVVPPMDINGPGSAFAGNPSPSQSPSAVPEGEEALHEEAKRLARLLVSEIKLYNEEVIDEGRREGNIYARLREDIDRSRQMYDERIDPRLRQGTDYFVEELVQRLAGGDASVMGL